MIVICEQCETRFKLDEERIPSGGARVRCSRCKHAFFLPAAGGDEPDLLDELIGQTATDPPKEPGEELEDVGLFPLEPPAQPPAAEPEHAPSPRGTWEEEAEEQEWEFNDALSAVSSEDAQLPSPSGSEEGSGLELAVPAGPAAQEKDPAREEARAVAVPPVPESGLDRKRGSGHRLDRGGEPAPLRAGTGMASGPATPLPVREPAGATVAPPAEVLEAPERAGLLLNVAGWLATGTLAALVALQLLAPSAPTEVEPSLSRSLGPLLAESARGRFVENLHVGPLLVVTADLHNPGGDPTSLGASLQAVLLDGEGERIPGARAALAPASEREIREQPPELLAGRLAERGRALAAEVWSPGQRRRLTAVFPEVPPQAIGFDLETGPRLALPARAPQPEAGEVRGRSASE